MKSTKKIILAIFFVTVLFSQVAYSFAQTYDNSNYTITVTKLQSTVVDLNINFEPDTFDRPSTITFLCTTSKFNPIQYMANTKTENKGSNKAVVLTPLVPGESCTITVKADNYTVTDTYHQYNQTITFKIPVDLPVCIQKLSSLKATSDPYVFQATFVDYGQVQLYISTKRVMTFKDNKMGSWSCDGDKVNIVMDNPTGTGTGTGTGTTPTPDPHITPTSTSNPATTGSGFALNVKINNPLKVDTVQGAIKLFMDAVLKIAIPLIVIFFIWSGLSFVLARGNPEKIKTAKNMFWYTIIGTLLILGAWTITNAIIGTVNSITG